MLLNIPYVNKPVDVIRNYDLYLMPNGVYRAKKIIADNYLYPMYYIKEGDHYILSTSVYALIHYKKKYIRNPKFQTTIFYRPTFMTIDKEIMRARTEYRRSTMELTDPDKIIRLGAKLIQEYITEIEEKYPGWVHILLMGGKDSENIILTQRKERWIVVTGEPSDKLNEKFLSDNKIDVESFIPVSNDTDNTYLQNEIIASDCFADVKHFRWVGLIHDIVKKYNNKAILWMGTNGDGIFSKNNNHRDKDYFAVGDLHVGTFCGILHQMYKNFLNIPVLSPYNSPQFLDELFYKFDPYFVIKSGDVRKDIGKSLHGKDVKYPSENPEVEIWNRNRSESIKRYINQLESDRIICNKDSIISNIVHFKEQIQHLFNTHSAKRRSKLSKILFPLRMQLSKIFPVFEIKRHDIASTEIK